MIKTTSLKLSKQLREAGFPQESYFWWSNAMDELWRKENREFFKVDKRRDIASPTAEEILERLPNGISVGRPYDSKGDFRCQQEEWNTDDWPGTHEKFDGITASEAAGQMWLYLDKEGLLEKNK